MKIVRLAFKIATQFLKNNKGQTILILLGITIGISVQIFIGSLIDGLQLSLVDKTIGSSSHITISPSGKENYFEDKDDVVSLIRSDERFTQVSTSLDAAGFLLYEEETYSLLTRGFNFDDANGIYKFDERIVNGRLPSGESEVALGIGLVEELGLEIGDNLDFIIPELALEKVELVGVFDLRIASLNKSWMITELSTAQNLFQRDKEISSIETQIKEVFDADLIAEELESTLDSFLKIDNWKAQNEELLSGLTGQSASSYMIQVFVLLAVLLGISSVLAISVVQKSRQLGILKAMGIKNKTASQIFLFQGLILGIIGGILGTGLGIGLTYVFSVFVTNPDGTPLVPFYLDYGFVAFSVAIAIIAAMIAAFIPARKSSKLNPIEVIRNG